MIIGHATIRTYFENAAKNGILHHAYCLVGPSQIGKRTLARIIAGMLLEVPPERLATHPDFEYIERTTDEKTGKLHKEISVEQARKLREKLQNRSWVGGYRVVIIDEAELLNTEASNALLKTLEEPAEKSVIFLLTENEDALLPTIRSRSQVFQLGLLSDSEIASLLSDMNVSQDRLSTIMLLAAGCPGRAVSLASDEGVFDSCLKEVGRWGELIGQPLYKKIALLETLFGDKDDGVRGREKIAEAFGLWIMLWREVLRFKLVGESPWQQFVTGLIKGSNRSEHEIVQLIDRLSEARTFLARNVQPRLVVEQAVLNF